MKHERKDEKINREIMKGKEDEEVGETKNERKDEKVKERLSMKGRMRR
jgi:hypothetical protein